MSILAYPRPVYQPAMRIISSITNATSALVTTTFAHNYITGQIIRLLIPPGYGMLQADTLYAPIVVQSDTTFTIAIDTTQMDPFVIPGSYPLSYQHAQTSPIGEVSETLLAATHNALPYSG